MRTTLSIDDDILAAARSLADHQRKSLGVVISELARKGLEPRPALDSRNGLPIFKVSPGSSPITMEKVEDALKDSE